MLTKKNIVGMVLLFLASVAIPAWATTYYVDPNGSDSNDGLSWPTAFATIQKGISEANDGNEFGYAIVDINSGRYDTGPIIIDNNYIAVNFYEEVEVVAISDVNKPGTFMNDLTYFLGDCLFEARSKDHLRFNGNNTVLRMRKSEYAPTAYFDANANVDLNTDEITVNNHKLVTQDPIRYYVPTDCNLGGLEENVVYYAIRVNDNVFKVALTPEKASDDNEIDLTSKPASQTHYFSTGEWRHAIRFGGCFDVNVRGLIIRETGGDGITITRDDYNPLRQYSQNVVVEDVICEDNFRCGMAVGSVNDLTIENCVLKESSGTSPQCGIDFEPDLPEDRLSNIVMRDCIIRDNAGGGIMVFLLRLNGSSEDISLTFENCAVLGSSSYGGIVVADANDEGPGGEIAFEHCYVENIQFPIRVISKSRNGAGLVFDRCIVRNTPSSAWAYPINLSMYPWWVVEMGGIEFTNCQVFDDYDRPAIKYTGDSSDTLYDITGTLYVHNDNRTGPLKDWNGAETNNVTLNVISGFADLSFVFNPASCKGYSSIQSAIDDTNDGNEIVVYPGTYYEGIDFNGKTITLRSADPNNLDVVEATVIDGNGAANVVTFGADSGANLRGLTIAGGGRGVYCSGGAPAISNCIIRNNNNEGIYAESSAVIVKNCLIYDNGGGMTFQNAEGTVRNNTIVNNTNYGIQVSGGYTPTISNCILWNNGTDLAGSTAAYSWLTYDGDPCFVNADGNDFHITIYSPCIDAGDPNGSYTGEVDIDGEMRVIGEYVDIGVDEGFSAPVPDAHWWKLDETSGVIAYDSVGDANGTFNGNDPCWITGLFSGAVDFNGVSDYFNIPGLNYETDYKSEDAFSVAGWFKTSQSAGIQTIIGQWCQMSVPSCPNCPYQNLYFGWQVLVENNKVVARFGTGSPSITEILGTK